MAQFHRIEAFEYELFAGGNAHVVKPVDFQAFVEAVRMLGVWAVVNEPPHID